MFYIRPSALPRFLVAVLFVLFMVACDTLNLPPTDDSEPVPTPQSCSATNNELELAEASSIELELACLIISHPDQQRPEMHYHPTLGEIARARAKDMAENGYYGKGREHPPHVDNNGYGPNHYLCLLGYRQDLYCVDDPYANSVESIAMGYNTAASVLGGWYNSFGHRRHILGEIEAFRTASHYGIGHAVIHVSDEFEDWGWERNLWVFIAARPPDISAVSLRAK